MTKSVIYSTLTMLILLSPPVKAWDDLREYKKDFWDIEFRPQNFVATGNYNRDGTGTNNLPANNSYTLTNLDFGFRWTPSLNWGIYTQMNASSSTSFDGKVTRNNSGLNNAKIGFDYLFYSGNRVEWIMDFFSLFPFKRIETTDDTSANQEGVIEVGGRIIWRMSFKYFVPFASIGLTYRDDGRSTLMPVSLGSELVFGSNSLGVALTGFNSVLHYDEKTSNRYQRESFNTQKNGGAYKFYAVNPNYLETQVWYRYNGDGMFGFQLGYGLGVLGQDYAAGWNVFAAVNLRFGGDNPTLQPGKINTNEFKENIK